ncbi:hypothetical protein ACS0TY_028367 [Phlomoides rotata]
MDSGDEDDRSPSPRGSAAGGANNDKELPRAKSNRTLLNGTGSFSGGRGSNWTSSVPIPASDIPINNNKVRMMSRHDSTRMDSDSDPTDISFPDASSSLLRSPSRPNERSSGRFDLDGPMKRLQREEEEAAAEAEESDAEEMAGTEAAEEEQQRPVRMSLMSLLAETDEDGIGYGMDDDDDDEDDDDDGGEYNSCCICMVRHKGTAFEPCGHSFCRLCSREMWVQGGNCPLCNNYILEILDIF